MSERLKLGRRIVELTHPDKVLFPRPKLTKRDLARHYERVAPVCPTCRAGRSRSRPTRAGSMATATS